ncbi:MAG: hypothetical protein ACM3U2_14165 [Deltaproteobacteria bacterium]
MHAFSRRVVVCVAVCLAAASVAVAKQPIKKLKHDPKVPPVALFDAMEAGTVETAVIARDSHEASLFVTNKSDAPVTVQMPKAVVAVQVLKQFFGQQNRGGNTGPGMPGGNTTGGAQPMGMGMQNNLGNNMPGGMNNFQGNGFNNIGVGNGNGNGPGGGFFTVPPQKTVQVPMMGVCLAHGKPDPSPRMTYKLVKLEDYTTDPALHETLKRFAAGETDLQTAQAAVWHLTDKMSWQDLREKQIERLWGLDPLPYFSDSQIDDAEKLIRQVRQKVGNSARRAETAAR